MLNHDADDTLSNEVAQKDILGYLEEKYGVKSLVSQRTIQRWIKELGIKCIQPQPSRNRDIRYHKKDILGLEKSKRNNLLSKKDKELQRDQIKKVNGLDLKEMIMDPRLGKSDSRDMFRIQSTLTHLDELHEFCAENKFGYGMHDDGSVYISENSGPGYWWGRLFKNGVAENYFFLDKYKPLKPILMNIFSELRENNPHHFKTESE